MDSLLTKFFTDLTIKQECHRKWLNTLSFLEYIGTRKIIKSQDAGQLDCEMLQHIAEEANHALFFKKLSGRILPEQGETGYSEKELLAGKEAEGYFQNIDAIVANQLKVQKTRLNYLYVTFIVEIRAATLYRAYSQFMKGQDGGEEFQLDSVLQDESNHLQQTDTLIKTFDAQNFSERKKYFSQAEEGEFAALLSAWTRALG